MDALIVRLIEVTQKEVVTFQRLLEALEREQQALMHQNTDALATAVREQQGLTEAAAGLEKDRVEIVDRLAVALQEDRDALTLKRLVERIQGPQAEQLGEIRGALIDLQIKIQKVNRQNTLLIKQSMKYVDKTLQILSGSGNSGGVYEQSGKVENTPSPLTGIVDQVV